MIENVSVFLEQQASMPCSNERVKFSVETKPCALTPYDPMKHEENKHTFFAKQQELAAKYPKEWIAFHDGVVTYHGSLDNCYLEGAQHSYVVFPSNPSYYPLMECLWSQTLDLAETDRINENHKK